MKDQTIPKDLQAERCILSLIFCESDVELLNELDVRDFADTFHQWLFQELKLFSEGSAPFGDMLAWSRHVKSEGAADRWDKTGLEGEYILLTLDTFNEFASAAHARYYLTVLRRERVNRALRFLGAQLLERIDRDPDYPMATLAWLSKSVDGVWAKATEVLHEDVVDETAE